MPMPESLTTISTCELTRSSRTWTRPCFGVNLTAFDNRFQTTCCNRSGSPETGPTRGSATIWIRTCFASAAGCTVATALWMISESSIGWTSSRIFPDTIREISSTSSTIWVKAFALRSRVSRPRPALSPVRMPPRSSRA